MSSNIVLIGPSLSGKTTLAKLLGERLNRPVRELDVLRWMYSAELGYDEERAKQIRHEGGMPALAAYWKPFDIHAVERVLADFPGDCIIPFGAGHSVYDDDVAFKQVQAALAGHHVIFVRPSPDFEESIQTLKDRVAGLGFDPEGGITVMNIYFLQHHANADLATMVVYTKDKTPDATCTEIIERLNL
jgi:hypothetical protein